jgi:hypothetical protein
MTDEELSAIKARAEAATEGPWEVGHRCEIYTRHYAVGPIGDFWEPADARFTANARADIPALLAEVERLREELATRQWASVVDRMPPNKAPVIMATFWGGVFDGLWDADAGEWYMGTTRMPSITHWMPLPEPPEVQP